MSKDIKSWVQDIEKIKEINRKKRSEKRKAYYQKKKVSIGVSNKNWREANPERVREYNKQYYQEIKRLKNKLQS